jgi:hypothetical protein
MAQEVRRARPIGEHVGPISTAICRNALRASGITDKIGGWRPLLELH